MSVFEQYAANILMLFPNQDFLRDLYVKYRDIDVLSQLSFNQVYGLKPGSFIEGGKHDPNDYEDVDSIMHFLRLADFYDREQMPELTYFSSFDDLYDKLATIDTLAISAAMRTTNERRHRDIVRSWRDLLTSLENVVDMR